MCETIILTGKVPDSLQVIWSENRQYHNEYGEIYWVEEWYFHLDSVHGPFETEKEARETRDSMISDYYQDEMEIDNNV